MRRTGYLALTAMACGLSACDGAPRSQEDASNPAATAPAAGVKDSSTEVDAYLRRFAAENPETCFGEASVGSATFEAKSNEQPIGSPQRVLIAVDASGSMAGRVSGRSKLDLAHAAARSFIDGLPAEAEVGLLVFGQAGDNTARGKAPSCGAISLTVPLSRDRAALVRGVSAVKPVGWTPLAAALRQAEMLLIEGGRPGTQVIYVVSDGQETCAGDPVDVASRINAGPTKAIVNIIGFAVPTGEAAALAAVASAGGGQFINVDAGNQVDAVAARIRDNGRQAANRLAESGTTARNNLSTSGTAAEAQLCTSGIIARERLAVSADVAKKRIAGQDVAMEERAEKVLNDRHKALERRTAAFVERLQAKLGRANDAVAAEAAKVR